jgi:hypothetical protein
VNALQVDASSGFLDADNTNAFGAEKKIKLLEIATECVQVQKKWPDLSELCGILNLDPRTLDRHLKIDAKFADEFKAVMLQGKWKLESKMYELSTKNPMYMFGWLRKHFPAEYNPEYQNNNSVNVQVFVDGAKEMVKYQDAEVITSTQISSKQPSDLT